MRKQFVRILQQPGKGQESANNALGAMFRKIIHDVEVNPERGHRLMERYVSRLLVADPTLDKSHERNNLSQALANPKMTWYNFERGIRFLNVLRARLTLECWWTWAEEPTSHSVSMEFSADDLENCKVTYDDPGTDVQLKCRVLDKTKRLSNAQLKEMDVILNKMLTPEEKADA